MGDRSILLTVLTALMFQISLPTLRGYLYRTQSILAEAQHSIMQTAFLVMRSTPDPKSPDLQQSMSIFSHLLNRYFYASLEVTMPSAIPIHYNIYLLKRYSGTSVNQHLPTVETCNEMETYTNPRSPKTDTSITCEVISIIDYIP